MSEMAFDYSKAGFTIREDLPLAYRDIWKKISAPGNFWRGEDRIAIAAESRQARLCGFCAERKDALSPYTFKGEHETVTNLPPAVVDVVHRITTDAPRITEAWIDSLAEDGITRPHYVELLGIVVAVISIDAFHRALGLPLEPLPTPETGEPDGYQSITATDHGAYVPMVMPDEVTDDNRDLYDGQARTGNVMAAMSLIPDSVRMLKTLGAVQYLAPHQVADPTAKLSRAISRSQMEMLAGRVSSLSNCFY